MSLLEHTRSPALVAALVGVVALIPRLMGLDAGLPYCWHPDEPKLINLGLRMLQTGDWNPHWFHYPSLPIYLQAFNGVLSWVGEADGRPWQAIQELKTGLDDGLIHTVGDPAIWARGRRLTAILGALAAALTALAGHRLGGPLAGLFGGLFVALSPGHAAHSRLITVDVPTSCAIAALTLASAYVLMEGERRHFVLAGVAWGFAIACKYNAAIAGLAPLLAWLASPRRDERLWWGLALGPIAAITGVLAMPYVVLDIGTALNDIAKEVNHYMARGHGEATVGAGLPHLRELLGSLGTTFMPGWALLALISPALVTREQARPLALAWVLPVVWLGFMSGAVVFFQRTVVPIVPAVAVIAGLGAAALLSRLSERPRAAWALGLGLLAPGGLAVRDAAIAERNELDSRTELSQWLQAEERRDMVVAVPKELRWSMAELDGVKVVEVSLADGLAGWTAAGATHIIGSPKLKLAFPKADGADPEAVAAAAALFGERKAQQRFGSRSFTPDSYGANPLVALYALQGRRAAEAAKAADAAEATPATDGPRDAAAPPTPAAAPGGYTLSPADSPLASFTNGVITLRAAEGGAPPKACSADPLPLPDGPLRVVGRYTLDGVTKERMAAEVSARFFGQGGKLLPEDPVRRVVSGSGTQPWTSFDVTLTPPPDARRVRLCVELGAAEGTVQVDGLGLAL
ncbi:glycosyltransferase family 39 protein [Myxococcota bacterium]|nr:glycosyltransferase family 39 protein [Myxococcota bacterium]